MKRKVVYPAILIFVVTSITLSLTNDHIRNFINWHVRSENVFYVGSKNNPFFIFAGLVPFFFAFFLSWIYVIKMESKAPRWVMVFKMKIRVWHLLVASIICFIISFGNLNILTTEKIITTSIFPPKISAYQYSEIETAYFNGFAQPHAGGRYSGATTCDLSISFSLYNHARSSFEAYIFPRDIPNLREILRKYNITEQYTYTNYCNTVMYTNINDAKAKKDFEDIFGIKLN